MTLDQWIKLTGIVPTHPTTETGMRSFVINDDIDPSHGEYRKLDDYKFDGEIRREKTSVVYLIPRPAVSGPFMIQYTTNEPGHNTCCVRFFQTWSDVTDYLGRMKRHACKKGLVIQGEFADIFPPRCPINGETYYMVYKEGDMTVTYTVRKSDPFEWN